MSLCPFCEKRQADDVEYLGDGVMTFVPLNPVADGHRLFVPWAHVLWAAAIAPVEVGRCVSAAVRWAGALVPSFNIITSCGPDATQTVSHVHVHLVPRQAGDGLHLPWTGQ